MTSPPPPSSRPRWQGWALATTIPILALALCWALWLTMPLWLARLVVDHSPWFEPAFHATAKHLHDTNTTDPRLLASMMGQARRLPPAMMARVFAHLDDAEAGRRILAAAIIAFHFRPGMNARTPVPSHALATLMRLLGDENALVRIQAARALDAIGMRGSFPEVLKAIADIPPHLQPMADGLLADYDTPEAADVVLGWSRSEPLRESVVMGLGRMSDPRIADRLLELLVHPQEQIRRLAVAATANKGDPRLTEALAKACRDPDSTTREHALAQLVQRTNGLTLLVGLVDDPAAAAIRPKVMAALHEHADSLTPEQRQRLGLSPKPVATETPKTVPAP